MARRRVRLNTTLLLSIACGFLVLGGVGTFLYKHRHPRNPAPYILAGDEAMKQQDYDRAVANYAVAVELVNTDAALHVKLGRAYLKGQRLGNDGLANAVKEFTSAEANDPQSKDAWSGLLDTSELRVEQWEARPSADMSDREGLPTAINTAREAAEHLAQLEPNNLEAKAAGPIFIIRTWILNLAMPESPAEQELPADKRPTPEQRVEQAITDLTKMAREHPENERLPYWIARAKVYQAQQALKNSDHPELAPGLFAEALGEFDPSIAAKPDVIGLYMNKAEIIRQLMVSDPSATAAADYRVKLRDALNAAQALADPKNKNEYMAAKQQWAGILSLTDPYAAEQVYKEIISKFPDDIGVRMQLAHLLQRDATRRGDALAALDAIPSHPGASVTNPLQRENWELQVANSKLLRADIKTDQLMVTPQGKLRQQLVSEIQASLDSARKLFADTPQLLRVQGRFELANGQVVDAIATLQQALDKARALGPVDFDLLRTTANAYRAGTQTGKAIELLEQAMVDPSIANNADVRRTLAQLNLENKDLAKARPHIDWLAIRFPDQPQVIELEIAALGPNADPRVAADLFKKLPEKTPADISSKQRVAQQLGFKDENLRLMLLINKGIPGDIPLVFDLVQALKDAKRMDDANKVLSACEALNPDDRSLKVLEVALNGGSKAEVSDIELKAIMDIKDPFTRSIKLSEFYAAEQRTDEQLAALLSAEAIQPDNALVLQQIFQIYLSAGHFDQAEAMLPHLAAINADNAHGKMLECKLDLAKQDVQGALAASRQMTHDESQMSGSWEMYGEALEAAGQLDVACQQFETALSLQATNSDASRKLIQCSVQQGKLADAQAYIKQARTRFPNDPEYLDMDVQYEIQWGNPESVLGDLNTALHENPKDRRNYAMTADTLLACMRARAAKGDADGAAGYLSKALELFQTAVKTWPDDLRFSNGLAQMQLQSKDLAAAENTLKTISERPRWKSQPAPLILLGKVYLQANKLDQAEAVLKQALDADPKSVEARLVMSDCKVIEQKFDDALITLQPVLASFPVRQKYTDLLLELNKGAMAETQLDDAIKADPNNMGLINLRLHVYDAEGRYDQGLRAVNDALAANHSNVAAYYWKGKFEASTTPPNFEVALTDLGLFRDSMPTDVRGRVLIAAILDIKGDRDGAIHELEAALSFAPQERSVRLSLLRDYLTSVPPRMIEGKRLLAQTLALPSFSHDPEFESKAALVWAQTGETDKALAAIRDVIAHVKDTGPYMNDYFTVLLLSKNYQLLLQESDQYTGDPKTNWFVFNDRGICKAATGDFSGAKAEFQTALDRCAIEKSEDAASMIVSSIVQHMNDDKAKSTQAALDLVLPRAQNSVAWKLMAIQLYIDKNDIPDGLKLMEAALPSQDSLPVRDRLRMLQLASRLYLQSNPPMADKCIATYQQILAINPNDEDALNDMACVLSDLKNDPKGALPWSQKAYDLVLKTGRVVNRIYDTQGWILIQLDRYNEGIDILDKAIDESDFPDAHYHLASGYLKLQRPEDVQRELDKANVLLDRDIAQSKPFDASLKGKIEALSKQANQMIKDKTQVKADQ